MVERILRRAKRGLANEEEGLMHTVVLAIFNDEASADAAATFLKESGVAKGDAMGVLVLDQTGKIKADKVGKRSWAKVLVSGLSWRWLPRSGWQPA
jgi:hypothetical protein